MNHYNIRLTDLTRLGEIKYTSLKDRFKKKKLYASEVEMIAEHFGRPVSYYFDKESTGLINYTTEENLNLVHEPKANGLSSEETYQRRIVDLTKKLSVITQKFEKQNKKYFRLLEKVQQNSGER